MNLKYLLLLALAALAPDATMAQGGVREFRPGWYEALMLAVDGQGHITGYYREEQGAGVTKTCSFFLKGQARAGEAEIRTWSDRVLPGHLRAESDGVVMRIEGGSEHAGCQLVMLPQVSEGLPLDLVETAEWIELRRISSQRAYLHSDRKASSRLRAFVVRGDVVGVTSRSGAWLQAEYRGGKGKTVGWIRARDTAALVLPR